MARLPAGIAVTTSSLSAYAQGRAVCLNVTKTLAVIALLSYVASISASLPGCILLTVGCSGMRTLVRLVAWLLAIITEPLGRCAHLGVVANIATFVARAARKGRHSSN